MKNSTDRKARNLILQAYLLGGTFAVCLTGLYQDILGKERYIALVNEHWINLHWAVWIPLLLLILFFVVRVGVKQAALIENLSKTWRVTINIFNIFIGSDEPTPETPESAETSDEAPSDEAPSAEAADTTEAPNVH